MTDPQHDNQDTQQLGVTGSADLPREQVHDEDVIDLEEYDPDASDEDGHAEDDGQ